MNKTPVRWLDVVKEASGKVAKGTGLKAILPIAKKEWALIKSGKHPTMMVATGPMPKRKSSKRKSSKRKSSKRKSSKRKSSKRKSSKRKKR